MMIAKNPDTDDDNNGGEGIEIMTVIKPASMTVGTMTVRGSGR